MHIHAQSRWIRSSRGSGQRKVGISGSGQLKVRGVDLVAYDWSGQSSWSVNLVAYDWSGQSSWSVNLVSESGLGSEVGQ